MFDCREAALRNDEQSVEVLMKRRERKAEAEEERRDEEERNFPKPGFDGV